MINAIRSILPYLVLFVASAPECLSLQKNDTPRGELSKYIMYVIYDYTLVFLIATQIIILKLEKSKKLFSKAICMTYIATK